MYRVGLPFWKVIANLGFRISIRIYVMHDSDANVFIAESPDLHGLVAEANSLESLKAEVQICIDELLSLQLKPVHGAAIAQYQSKDLIVT